jgi:RNA polymerase sigma-70 factor, ECF subfamily
LKEHGQQDWCVRLYREKAANLLLYGRALGLSHSEAEDVLHEVFVSMLKMSSKPVEPEHYVVRSYRHRALNCRRSLWRRLAREMEASHWFERSNGETEMEQAAVRCLARLPTAQVEVIVLKIWHRHTFEEIGSMLEVSPNTVAARYRYGLQKMRSCLKGEYHERAEFTGGGDEVLETESSFRAA